MGEKLMDPNNQTVAEVVFANFPVVPSNFWLLLCASSEADRLNLSIKESLKDEPVRAETLLAFEFLKGAELRCVGGVIFVFTFNDGSRLVVGKSLYRWENPRLKLSLIIAGYPFSREESFYATGSNLQTLVDRINGAYLSVYTPEECRVTLGRCKKTSGPCCLTVIVTDYGFALAPDKQSARIFLTNYIIEVVKITLAVPPTNVARQDEWTVEVIFM